MSSKLGLDSIVIASAGFGKTTLSMPLLVNPSERKIILSLDALEHDFGAPKNR